MKLVGREKEIKILKEEIRLNDKKDNLQKVEILRSFSQYNTKDAFYDDDRLEFSAESYHKIDYRKKFEEQKWKHGKNTYSYIFQLGFFAV